MCWWRNLGGFWGVVDGLLQCVACDSLHGRGGDA
jgi:hypothetical protein